ncbi:MAG: hypothetical protein HQL84_02220 [Magnetococcales bacterium]|nr:hypothetical protein [Magnetococcales bacterium]MBF0148843.1 hypothetical protein [Magnetococcales bacterium]
MLLLDNKSLLEDCKFHGGTRVINGDFPADLVHKIDLLLDEFIELIRSEVSAKQLKPAIVRSMRSCNIMIILDSEMLWVAAQKQTGMPSTAMADHRQHKLSTEDIFQAAKWELGFDDPFIIQFQSSLLDQSTGQRELAIKAIVGSHIGAEVQRVNYEMNMIQINPIFGPAQYRVDGRLAFVLMPFTDLLTEIYNTCIRPTVEESEFNLVCRRADDIKSNRAIIQDIWKSICEARIIIADMTDLNPNVMYELGIAHTVGKETILLYQRQNNEINFPFDLAHIRRIEYDNTAMGGVKLRNDLSLTLNNVLLGGRPE